MRRYTMTTKKYRVHDFAKFQYSEIGKYIDENHTNEPLRNDELVDLLNELHEENQSLKKKLEFFYELNKPYGTIIEENKRLKSQLYCDDEEGVCNICKHHYLIKDDEAELGYYNLRCKKGHYECARVSLKYCEDFKKELKE